jgi:hypothetical protein
LDEVNIGSWVYGDSWPFWMHLGPFDWWMGVNCRWNWMVLEAFFVACMNQLTWNLDGTLLAREREREKCLSILLSM